MQSLSPEQQTILDGLTDPDDSTDPIAWTENHPDDPLVFTWDEKQQRQVLGALLLDREFMAAARRACEPGYFKHEAHEAAAKIAFAHWDKYGELADKSVLFAEMAKATASKKDAAQLLWKAELNTALEFYEGLNSRKYWLDQILYFGRYQKVRKTGYELIDDIKQGKKDIAEITLQGIGTLKDSLKIGGDVKQDIISGQELLAKPDPSWLVKDHLPQDSTALIYGEYGSLKSFYALELCLCVAASIPFLKTHPVKQGTALYIVGEGEDGIKQRLRAWLKYHEMEKCPDGFFVISRRFDFSQPTEAATLIGMCEAREIKPSLVIIDTLAKNIAGSDNDAEAMLGFGNSMESIREGLDGAVAVAIHHVGKDRSRGPRGYSGLISGVNTALELERTDGGCSVRCEKQKDAACLDKYSILADVVDLGLNEHGEPQSSLALKPSPTVTVLVDDAPLNQFVALFPTEAEKAITLAEVMGANEDWFAAIGWSLKTVRNKLSLAQKERGPFPYLACVTTAETGSKFGGKRYYAVP